MAEKKKQKSAGFAQEKNTFTGEIPKKASEGKNKKSVAYQPRSPNVILHSRTALFRRKQERNRAKNIPATITATGTPIIRHRKRAGIKGGR